MTTVQADLAPTGVLRASINLGNPVLANGTPDAPGGVTVDIARELAKRLDLPLQLVCFDAARKSYEAAKTKNMDKMIEAYRQKPHRVRRKASRRNSVGRKGMMS